jgi:hypothetical protein
MSSVKRRKVGGDVPAAIHRKASSDLASAASRSPDPEVSNATSHDKAPEGAETPKTFKDLVCNLELLKFEYIH